MKNRLMNVLFGAMLLSLSACTPEVWLFGDSITGLYCDNVQALHPEWHVTCLGVGGEQTGTGLTRLQSELATRRPLPNFLVIEEGINNCVAHSSDACPEADQDPTWIINDLLAMRDATHAVNPNIKVFVTSTLYSDNCPIPDYAGSCLADGTCPSIRCFYNNACNLDAAIYSTFTDPPDTVIDITIPGTDFADLLHPNDPDGQNIVAQAVSDAIVPYIPTTTSTTTTSSTTSTTLP